MAATRLAKSNAGVASRRSGDHRARDQRRDGPNVVRESQGYVDTGHGHIGRNETSNPAKDVVVAIAPVGLPFRNELPAPGPYCAFSVSRSQGCRFIACQPTDLGVGTRFREAAS
jgi:hypothetical protein